MFFNPLTLLVFLLFLIFVFFFFILVQIDMIMVAFAQLDIPPQHIFGALFFTLVGSYINIPIKRVPQDTMVEERWIRFYGFRYMIPVWKKRETVIAVNLGGAVITTFLSLYLLLKTGLWAQSIIATVIITLASYWLAKPVRGVGIVLPFFTIPILAAFVSVIFAYNNAPVIAYISGTMGTLIGADLLNLKKISKLGAPVASIGGAGTFDGIFLTGILAVLLSAFLV
jgi:uncharacterized membrane protein